MSLRERVSSLETEYAVSFYPATGSRALHHDDLIRAVRDVLTGKLGGPDHHFLVNGSKMDRDVGQLEWSLPECRSAHEVVVYDQAADSLLQQAVASAEQHLAAKGHVGRLKIFKNNVDFQGQTYGCHENYQTVQQTELLNQRQFLLYLIYCLTPFLVTRQILTGAGNILPARLAPQERGTFTLSQRAAFIQTAVSAETRRQRPIINLARENEALADDRYRRLHLILGDSNLSPWANWIKIGTMGILLRMIEDQFLSEAPALLNPVDALHRISLNPTCRELVELCNGERLTAIDIQWYYCEQARAYFRQFEASAEENDVLTAWTEALNDLAEDPMLLADRADWAIKRRICEQALQHYGASWEQLPEFTARLLPYDLRYHDLSNEGHFNRLCQALSRIKYARSTQAEIDLAQRLPPPHTRANMRGYAIALARRKQATIKIDGWCDMQIDRHQYHSGDPLDFEASWAMAYTPLQEAYLHTTMQRAETPVRVRTVGYLGWRQEAQVSALLLEIIQQDESPEVRRAAAESLGRRADPNTFEPLLRLLTHETNAEVQWAIQTALTRIIKKRPVLHIGS